MSIDANYPEAFRAARGDRRLLKLGVSLSMRDQEYRTIFLWHEAAAWIADVLRTAQADGVVDGASSPLEQLLVLGRNFCAGRAFEPPLPHLMRPETDGIWRFRTADLRLVGWFPARATFVVAAAELKSNCVGDGGTRDEELLSTARTVRCELSIDDPSFIWEDLNDCL